MLLNHSLIPWGVVRKKESSTILSFDSQKPLYSLEIKIPPYEIKPSQTTRPGDDGRWVCHLQKSLELDAIATSQPRAVSSLSNVLTTMAICGPRRRWRRSEKTWQLWIDDQCFSCVCSSCQIMSNLVQEIDCFWLERLRIGLAPCTRHFHRCEKCDGILCTVIELTWCRGQTHFSRRGRLKHL